MQDRIYQIVEIFLHRTAGPYIWVAEQIDGEGGFWRRADLHCWRAAVG